MQEYIIGKLGLILPKYTGKMSRKRELIPEALEHWRSHLDLNDLEKSCKALYVTLLDCHQAKLSPEERFESLNLLRPTVGYLSQSLMNLCPNNKGIISDHYRSIIELAQQLNLQMYHGYKMILEQTAKNIFSYRDLTFESLFTCMHICSKLIFEAHYQYRKPAKYLWKEMHLLYSIAEKRKYHKKSLAKLTNWSSRFDSMEDAYKHILLFAISQPNHHTPERLEQLKYALEFWAPLVSFESLKTKKAHSYMVSTQLDRGPVFVKQEHQATGSGWYLGLNKVCDHLKSLHSYLTHPSKRQKENAFTAAETSLSPEFVQFLKTCWTNRSEREQERKPASGKIEVTLGINSIHWFLSEQLPQTKEHTPILSKSENEEIDLGASALPEMTQTSEVSYECFESELLDQSPNGACLKWLGAIPANLCCGEVIAFSSPDKNNHQWYLGNIRWIKEDENKNIVFGVQILSTEFYAAKSWLIDANQQQAVCTLLIPENLELDRPTTLITPSIPFKLGSEVNVLYSGTTYHASLQQKFSASSSYQQYVLEFFEQAPQFGKKRQDRLSA